MINPLSLVPSRKPSGRYVLLRSVVYSEDSGSIFGHILIAQTNGCLLASTPLAKACVCSSDKGMTSKRNVHNGTRAMRIQPANQLLFVDAHHFPSHGNITCSAK
ncbi:hypothetical protein SUGI_0074000 [Cryptomeria japonica]|nr:hypothetical protein SUGI_0074000 [Cryptomeria japonica]